jgi:predicted membrane metal-binding protein
MGTSFAIPILLLVIIGLILGTLINFAATFLAIPIVLFIMVNALLMSDAVQRQRRIHKMRQFRESARAKKVDFTDEDKRTVVT